MNKSVLFIVLFFLISCASDSEPINTPNENPSETFSAWTPNFTNQTTNFTQTRTGSLGTQQSRTITVTTSSSSNTTTEETLSTDVNEDNDLFDEIEVVVTSYTASENLGSFEVTEYIVLVDNNNGILIGNEFIDLDYGYLEWDGGHYFCSVDNEFTWFIFGLNNIGSSFSDGNFYGDGYLVESELLIDTETLIDGFDLSPEQEYELTDGLVALNDYYGVSFSTVDDWVDWYDENNQDSDGDGYYDFEEVINNSDPNDSNSLPNGEYISPLFCNTETSSLEYTFTGLSTDLSLNAIIDGNYDEDWIQIFSTSYKIVLNTNETYSVIIEGESENSLPVKIFFKGYLSLYDDRNSQAIAPKGIFKSLHSKNKKLNL